MNIELISIRDATYKSFNLCKKSYQVSDLIKKRKKSCVHNISCCCFFWSDLITESTIQKLSHLTKVKKKTFSGLINNVELNNK